MSKRREKVKSTQTVQGRRLILVDVENIVGKPRVQEGDIEAVREWSRKALRIKEHDLVVVGTSGTASCLAAMSAWRGVRHVLRRGHNGADLALIHALGQYRVETFDEVIILSGDGIFAEAVARIVKRGIAVSVMSVARCISGYLVFSASCVHFIRASELSAA